MFQKLVLTMLMVLVAGCATNAPTATVFAGFNAPGKLDAVDVAAASASLKLSPQASLSTTLEADNRVLPYGGFRSFYRAVQVEAENKGEVTFTVSSFCACFGYDKRVAVPILLAFDGAGKPLSVTLARYETVQAAGITPLRVVLTGRVATGGAKAFRMLLLADNSMPDAPVQRLRLVTQYGAPLMNLEILSYPMGRFLLEVASPKD